MVRADGAIVETTTPGGRGARKSRRAERAEAAPPGREPTVRAARAIFGTMRDGRGTGETRRGDPGNTHETAAGNARTAAPEAADTPEASGSGAADIPQGRRRDPRRDEAAGSVRNREDPAQ